MLGPQELILVLIVILMIFRPKRIPETMCSLANGIKIFKRAAEERAFRAHRSRIPYICSTSNKRSAP